MYKILRFHLTREELLEGPVFAGDERWDSIDEALDELSAHGWDIQLPVYGPVRHDAAAATRLDGLIMVNHAARRTTDLTRRITKLEALLEQQRQALAGSPDTSMRHRQLSGDIARNEAALRQLREHLHTALPATELAIPNGTPLVYGEFPADGFTTVEDFALAEWHPKTENLDGA